MPITGPTPYEAMRLFAEGLLEELEDEHSCTEVGLYRQTLADIEAEARSTPAETLDVSPEALRSRAKDIRDEFRADEAENGLDAALAHIALALAQAEARLPFDPETERIVRQTLAIVDQTTPLSVGEPLVQLILARLHESDR